MSFRRGQKVVCVADSAVWAETVRLITFYTGAAPPIPDKDGVYTIAAIDDLPQGCFLQLVELPPRPPFSDLGYLACNFRPAVSPEISIAVFHEILAEVNRRKCAPAPRRELETVNDAAALVQRGPPPSVVRRVLRAIVDFIPGKSS